MPSTFDILTSGMDSEDRRELAFQLRRDLELVNARDWKRLESFRKAVQIRSERAI